MDRSRAGQGADGVTRTNTAREDHRLARRSSSASIYAGFRAGRTSPGIAIIPTTDMHDIGGDGWFGVRRTRAAPTSSVTRGRRWCSRAAAPRSSTTAAGITRARRWCRRCSPRRCSSRVEVKDYFYYEFSPGDFTFNTLGALAALAFDLSPRLDELFDFRVQYWPSDAVPQQPRSDSPCASACPGSRAARAGTSPRTTRARLPARVAPRRDSRAARHEYGHVVAASSTSSVGFDSRNYKPPPTLDPEPSPRTQELVPRRVAQRAGPVRLPRCRITRSCARSRTACSRSLTPPLTRSRCIEHDRATRTPRMTGGA